MINLEQSLLCTVLENDFINRDKRISDFNLDERYFFFEQHKFLIRGISRLKELNEPVGTDMLRYKIQKANKWSNQTFSNFVSLDECLLNIISATPFTYDLFIRYYDVLKKDYEDSLKTKELFYI